METATFAAGCFWCIEKDFRRLDGVKDAAVGYMGGHTDNPTYKEVCSGTTGHAEVCQVYFDPEKVSYQTLLNEFWGMHDPTQMNRQGPDVGSQYRSAIFYHSEEQKQQALLSKESQQNSPRFQGQVIVTEISKAGEFTKAEEYHQRYYEKMQS